MTRGEVVQWLETVQRIDRVIDNKLIEKEQLLTIATKTTQAPTGMPHANGITDKVANCAAKMADISAEIDSMVILLCECKKDVTDAIQRLPMAQYDVLHKIYIQGMSIEDCAAAREQSYQWTCELRNRGLQALQSVKPTQQYIAVINALALDRKQSKNGLIL